MCTQGDADRVHIVCPFHYRIQVERAIRLEDRLRVVPSMKESTSCAQLPSLLFLKAEHQSVIT